MEKQEDIIDDLIEILEINGNSNLADLLRNSVSELDVSNSYGNRLYSLISSLIIYSPPKETAKLNMLSDENKESIFDAVLQIYPLQDEEPEVREIIYKVGRNLKKEKNRMNWNKSIFLAHAKEDKPFVRKLYKKLKDSGLEPWLDEESLVPGARWDDKIKEAIKNSRFFLACISKNSIEKSGYVQKELRMALNELEQKPPDVIYFIPVLVDDVELPNISVGTINLRDYHAVQIFTSEGLDKLISSLRKQMNLIEEVEKKEEPKLDKVRDSIAHGNTNRAIEMLLEYARENDEDFFNNVLILSSRFKRLKYEEISGTISKENYNIQSNQIVYSLLELIKLIETRLKEK